MKQPFGLIAATSVIALLSAGTIAYAGGPDTAAVASNSHVNLSIEGWHARTNDFRSIFVVNGVGNGKLDAQSKWGWAVNLGYTFDDQSDVTASYRNIKKENTKTHTYKSVQSLASGGGTYDANVTLGDGTNSIGDGNPVKGIAAVIGTEQFAELGTLKYQQSNIDWGHTFNPISGFYFRPYVGAAWRSIGYKDTLTFSAKNNDGGTLVAGNYLTIGALAANADIKTRQSTASSSSIKSYANNAAITAGATGSTLADTADNNIFRLSGSNAVYDTGSANTYLGTSPSSFDSKFTGIGPRFGFDSHYTFGDNFSVVGGLVFSAPYGTQKTTATIRTYTDTNATGRGSILQGGTGIANPSYVDNANLQAGASTTAISYSSSEHKIIPEVEMNLGVRMSNDITQGDDMTYFIEAGYRVIHDWNAIKNIDFAATTAAGADGTRGPAFQYEDESDFGPYMKFGMTFGT